MGAFIYLLCKVIKTKLTLGRILGGLFIGGKSF